MTLLILLMNLAAGILLMTFAVINLRDGYRFRVAIIEIVVAAVNFIVAGVFIGGAL